ncbi:hypothetical protein [Agarilytica rhodophyticola]|uniref:hypothetical protein n=1 Tax=Agarilytica rhodophyticola TaxID=1737490 RepID=UPI000B343E47|nr:hypothetical protein [Agarilytica rhodophyticola]
MTELDIINLAKEFLTSRSIGFVSPSTIGREYKGKVEVIFPVPETLDPNVAVVDPPDVRVLVNLENQTVELIDQM